MYRINIIPDLGRKLIIYYLQKKKRTRNMQYLRNTNTVYWAKVSPHNFKALVVD